MRSSLFIYWVKTSASNLQLPGRVCERLAKEHSDRCVAHEACQQSWGGQRYDKQAGAVITNPNPNLHVRAGRCTGALAEAYSQFLGAAAAEMTWVSCNLRWSRDDKKVVQGQIGVVLGEGDGVLADALAVTSAHDFAA